MKIELYPDFEEVFDKDTLKGIFYPLCKVSEISFDLKEPLFFVSSNGIWTDKTINNDNNRSDFTVFYRKNEKYVFKGDLEVYIGYKEAKEIFEILEIDFEQNGEDYLVQKIKTELYIQNIIKNYNFNYKKLDINYFLQTFYEFSINKLNYQKTGDFGAFQGLINGWKKSSNSQSDNSQIVYEIKNDNSSGYADIEINKEYLFPENLDIENYQKIGSVIGCEFFTDGNDSYLLYDQNNDRVICINHYS